MTTNFLKNKLTWLMLIGTIFMIQSFANVDKNPTKKKNIAAKVSYMGIQEDHLLFTVNFEKENKENKKRTEIRITVNDDTEVFSNLYTAEQGKVLFKINTTNISKVNFEISNNGDIISRVFYVKATYREEIDVQPVQ